MGQQITEADILKDVEIKYAPTPIEVQRRNQQGVDARHRENHSYLRRQFGSVFHE
jgi:hypothetical protein